MARRRVMTSAALRTSLQAKRCARRPQMLAMIVGVLCGLLLSAFPAEARSTAPAPSGELTASRVLSQLRRTTLAEDRAVELRDVSLDLGHATFEVSQGLLVPTLSPAGELLEVVFIGQARFKAFPPNEIEAGQVQLFTGRRTIDTPVEEAVLVLAGERRLARMLEEASPTHVLPATMRRVEGVHASWLARTERRSTGVETALLLHLLGDQLYERYFAIWIKQL